MKRKLLLSIMFSILLGLSISAQWQRIGPGGGIIRCFAKGGSNIFAGTFGGGVYKTTDNGLVWTNINNGLTNTDVQALAVTNTGATVFAGTYNGGVFLSTDAGVTWTAVNSGLPSGSGLQVQALAIKGTKIYAGTNAGVYVSINNGGLWTAFNTGLGSTLDVLCLLVNGTDVFVGTGAGGVFLSANDGNWVQKNSGLANIYVNALAVNGSKLYAGNNAGIYSSANNGGSWSVSYTTSALVKSIDVNSNGTTIFAGYGTMTSGGIVRSLNNGSAWGTVNTGIPTSKGVYAVLQSGSAVFAGTDGKGLYITADNGANWTSDPGITNTNAQSLSLATSGTDVFAGVFGSGIYRSSSNGSGPWTEVNSGLPSTSIQALATNGTTAVFTGTYANGVYKSVNNGASWSAMNTGLTNMNVTCLAIGGGYIYAGTFGGGVFRALVGGTSWTQINSGITTLNIVSLAASGTKVFVGTFYGNAVCYSNNNGTTWAIVNTGLTNTCVNTLAISGTRVYAGTVAGVFSSGNNGTTWVPRSSGLTNLTVQSVFTSGYKMFAGTDGGGVFFSNDSANTWSAVNTNLGHFKVWALAQSGSDVFVGTKGGGVWKRPMADFDLAITTQSADLAACGTNDVYFSVAATGVNVTYQWQVSTDNGSTFNNCFNGPDYSGVSTNTLTCLAAQLWYKNGFKYQCVITSGPSLISTLATLTVNETPSLSVTDTATCLPNTIDITTSSTFVDLSPSVGPVTFWTDPGATVSLTNPTSVSSGGTYYIKKTVGSCFDIKPVVVTISAAPNLSVSDPSGVCAPNTVDITGTFTDLNSSAGTITYWSDPGATISVTTPAAISTAGTYYIKKTVSGTCLDIKPVVVVINDVPNLIITNPSAICFPNTVDITGSFTDLNSTTGTVTYWTDSLLTIPLTTPSAVATSGTYYIQKIATGGCLDIESVKVIIRQLPAVSYTQSPATVCDNDVSFALTGGSPAGGNYSGTGVSANVFDPSIAGSGNWTIVYTYSDVYTCTNTASQGILVDLCTGIDETVNKGAVTVFPNPFSTSLTLIGIESSADVLMYNVLGAQVGSWSIVNSTTLLEMSNIPSGVYYLQIKTESETSIKKIIKE